MNIINTAMYTYEQLKIQEIKFLLITLKRIKLIIKFMF